MTSVFPGFKRHRHEIELGVMCHPSLRQIIRQSPKSIAMRTFSFLLSSPLNSFLILGKYQAFGVFDQVVFFENRKCQVKSQEVKQSGRHRPPCAAFCLWCLQWKNLILTYRHLPQMLKIPHTQRSGFKGSTTAQPGLEMWAHCLYVL